MGLRRLHARGLEGAIPGLLGIALISTVGLRHDRKDVDILGEAKEAKEPPRNCPNQYGGIATRRADASTRPKAAAASRHALKDFGERVQLSVFECRLDAEALARLRKRIEVLTKPEEDRVRIYRLCKECAEQVEIRGAGKLVEDPDVVVL